MKRLFSAAFAILASCNHSPKAITVGAAISLKEASADLKPPGHVEWAYGASGDLASQMERGAPFDVLVAAGEQPRLAKIATEQCTIAWNTLVLVKRRDQNRAVGWDELATTGPWFRLAIGLAPQVPAGVYAEEALRKLGEWDALAPRVVRGTNVRHVLDLVARGEADEGIVYATDAAISKDVEVVGEVPTKARPNVRYPVYVSNAAPKEDQAVVDYLCAPEAKRVLASHGFLDHPP